MKVLFVEDDLLTVDWVTFFFQSNKIEILTVDSIASAIQSLVDFHPDVIISDMSLKGENAFDLLNHLQKQDGKPNIPVIVVTGYRLELSEQAKFQGYLIKPVDPQELLNLVRKFESPTSNIST